MTSDRRSSPRGSPSSSGRRPSSSGAGARPRVDDVGRPGIDGDGIDVADLGVPLGADPRPGPASVGGAEQSRGAGHERLGSEVRSRAPGLLPRDSGSTSRWSLGCSARPTPEPRTSSSPYDAWDRHEVVRLIRAGKAGGWGASGDRRHRPVGGAVRRAQVDDRGSRGSARATARRPRAGRPGSGWAATGGNRKRTRGKRGRRFDAEKSWRIPSVLGPEQRLHLDQGDGLRGRDGNPDGQADLERDVLCCRSRSGSSCPRDVVQDDAIGARRKRGGQRSWLRVLPGHDEGTCPPRSARGAGALAM